jgi:hypothetical protein
MTKARLILASDEADEAAGRELELGGAAAIGRAPDNLLRIDDPMVSQYHALVERRGDSFWLIDLDSTNGTTVNGDAVTTERRLSRGDRISVGGVAAITFHSDERPHPDEAPTLPSSHTARDQAEGGLTAAAEEVAPAGLQAQDTAAPRASALVIAAAVVVGVAIAGGAAMLAMGGASGSGVAIRVLSPETGATIRGAQTIRVDAEAPEEIEEVIYSLDGVRFASADYPPFEVTLDPAELKSKIRNLGSGNHVLTVTVQDKDGNSAAQPDTILLAFDLGAEPVDEEPMKRRAEYAGRVAVAAAGQAGAGDVASLARNLAAAVSGKSWYDFDPQFTDENRRRTDSYRVNVMEDAAHYRRQIGSAFSSKGLPAAIGFVMALSQSLFKEDAAARDFTTADQKIGLWLVPRQVALEQGYVAADEPVAALKDVKRSAEVAASYINDLVNAFGGTDQFMYAIACYGMPLGEAAKVRARLEEIDPDATERRNFWRMVKAGVVPRDGAERVAKFFAAGIVGENPQAFGLSSRPLSSLY